MNRSLSHALGVFIIIAFFNVNVRKLILIIGRFQNKTDLVPGLDKFTGSQSEVTKERDCTVLSSF